METETAAFPDPLMGPLPTTTATEMAQRERVSVQAQAELVKAAVQAAWAFLHRLFRLVETVLSKTMKSATTEMMTRTTGALVRAS